jgi:hypothetical protein
MDFIKFNLVAPSHLSPVLTVLSRVQDVVCLLVRQVYKPCTETCCLLGATQLACLIMAACVCHVRLHGLEFITKNKHAFDPETNVFEGANFECTNQYLKGLTLLLK